MKKEEIIMKKFLAVLTSVALGAALAGCGSTDDSGSGSGGSAGSVHGGQNRNKAARRNRTGHPH